MQRALHRIQKRRPTVVQLLHTLRVGGAEVLAARLARGLGLNYQFLFVCLDELGSLGRELREEGFPVRVLERKAGVDWTCSRQLARLCRQEQVDVIHAHQYTPFFYAMTARLLYRKPPVLFTEHGRHFPDFPRPKRMLANRLLLERRDRVIAVGRSVRRALIENEGIPGRHVGVIYNGIRLRAFAPARADGEAVRQECGVGPHDFVMMQVARLDPLKDHVTAIQVLERVLHHRRDARLVLVGEGPERNRLEELVRRRSLEPYVRFLGLRQDVGRLLGAADLCLLTSVSEGIPLTLIEGMAAGLPVVATNVGGVSEVVDDGRTGFLVPHGDQSGLADRILRLADNPSLRLEMGRLGRERASLTFSEEQMHAAYQDLYEEMLLGQRRAAARFSVARLR